MDVKGQDHAELLKKLVGLLPKDSSYTDVYGICYLAYKMKGHPLEECRRPNDWLSTITARRRLWNYLDDLLDSIDVGLLYELSQELPENILEDYLLGVPSDKHIIIKNEISSPELINELATELLDVKQDETLVNLNCGYGAFLVKAAKKAPESKCVGIEPDEHIALCALMRADVSNVRIDVSNESVLEWFDENEDGATNKIFLTTPFGQKLGKIAESSDAVQDAMENNDCFTDAMSADLMYAYLVAKSLSPSGKAVVPVITGQLEDCRTRPASSLPARASLVESGMVEAVISMPQGAFYPLTNVRTSIMVLSHGNSYVRLVDAVDLCKSGIWGKPDFENPDFPSETASKIAGRASRDDEFSKSVSLDDLREMNYRLVL